MERQATLEEARADVRSYIDDRNGRRWSDDQLKRTLHGAVSACMEQVAAAGVDRFDDEINVDTSASTGAASLMLHDPIAVRAVLVAQTSSGPWSYELKPADPKRRGALDTESRSLLVRLVKRPPMPEADTDLLVGCDDGAARSWPAFDRWVCMVAALDLTPTDDDPRMTLISREREMRARILEVQRIPGSLPWLAGRRREWATGIGALRWIWKPRQAELTLHTTVGW